MSVKHQTLSMKLIIIIVAAGVGSLAIALMIFLGIRYRLKQIRKNHEKNAFNQWHNVYEKDGTGTSDRRSEIVSRGTSISVLTTYYYTNYYSKVIH